MDKKQDKMMICPNYKMCKKCPNPYHKYPHALIVGNSDACNDIRGGCPACIPYAPEPFDENDMSDPDAMHLRIKEFAEKVIATMPINNQVKKQRVLMIAHIRAMAERGT